MSKGVVLVVGAVAVAAAVLLVTLFAGPDAPERRDRVESLGAIDLPTGIDESGTRDFDADAPVGGTERGEYAFTEGDRLTILRWASITPRGQDLSDVTQPVMHTYFSPRRDRLVELTADEGTVFAPEQQPRRGQLRRNVVLTLYETADGGPVDPESTRDIQVRVFLDDASFDLELGQVDSAGPVRLTGPTVDFKGHGLSLNYNQLRERLERLEIARGEWLRFKRDTTTARTNAPEAAPSATPTPSPTGSAPGVSASADTPADVPTADPVSTPAPPTDAPITAASPAGPQFYRARFLDEVEVVTGAPDTPDRVTMLGDVLIATFAFEKEDDAEEPEASPTTPAPTAPAGDASASVDTPGDVPGAPAAAASAPESGPAAAPPTAAVTTPADSLMPYGPDDVVITWTGRLVVQPEPDAADELAGPDDLLLAIEGVERPVRVATGQDDRFTAARADYLAEAGRLRAHAGEDMPLLVESSELGTLAGTSLELHRADRTGHVLGPGYLNARLTRPDASDPSAADPDAPAAGVTTEVDTPAPHAPPDTLEVAWLDRLDLTFWESPPTRDATDSDSARAGPDADFGAIRTATFRGDVTAIHPQFELAAVDTVAIDLTDPALGESTLERLRAEGDASLHARASEGQDEIDLDAQRLDIGFARGPDGQPQPTTIDAYDRVTVRQPTAILRTEELHAQAAPGVSASADTSDAPESPALALTHLTAIDNVELDAQDPQLSLRGQRLELDDRADRVEVFGTGDQLARVDLPEGTLLGEHLIIRQRAGTLNVPTAGSLALDTLPNDPDGALHIAWTDAMFFDQAAGFGEFLGDVVATTDSPTERTRLTADSLDLELDPAPAPGARTGTGTEAGVSTSVDVSDSDESPNADASAQRIRRAFARGGATFTAERFAPPDAPTPASSTSVELPSGDAPAEPLVTTLVRLRGPLMAFDNRDDAEIVHVYGAGDMIIKESEASDAPEAGASTAVSFTGRGDTLFQWNRQLTLDAGENTMTMTGGVRMTHQPPTGEPILFDADRLTADLTDSEGLASITRTDTADDDDAPAPQISSIEADGRIQIVQGTRTVVADHLRYNEATQVVTLTGDSGRVVHVTDDRYRIPITGGKIRWDLRADRFIVDQPGPITIPRER